MEFTCALEFKISSQQRVLKKEKAPIKYDDSQYFEENAIKLSDSKHMHTDLENTYDFIM